MTDENPFFWLCYASKTCITPWFIVKFLTFWCFFLILIFGYLIHFSGSWSKIPDWEMKQVFCFWWACYASRTWQNPWFVVKVFLLVIWVFGVVFFNLIWSPRLRNDTSSLCLISSLSHCWWCFIVSSIPLVLSPLFESSRLHFYICSPRKCFGLIFCYREMCKVLMKILPISLLPMLLSWKHIDYSNHSIVKRTYSWKNGPGIHIFVVYIPLVCYVVPSLTKCCWGMSNPPKVVFFLRIRYEYDNNFGEF